MALPDTGNILIVDDDEDLMALFKKMIKNHGDKIFEAKDGFEALSILENNQIDLVFSDFKMPKMDGLGLLKTINGKNIAVPVILVSAFGSWDTIRSAFELGAINFLNKPFGKEKFRPLLDEGLRLAYELRSKSSNEEMIKALKKYGAEKSALFFEGMD